MRPVLLAALLAAPLSAQTPVAFDAPAADVGALLQRLKAEAGPGVAGAVGRDLSPVPVIVTVPGLAFDQVGLALALTGAGDTLRWALTQRRLDPRLIADVLAERRALRKHPSPDVQAPDGYVERAVAALGAEGAQDFGWGRTADQTDAAVRRLELDLLGLSAQAGGRPIFIVSHSWGTVLAHEALARLADAGHPVAVRRLVTLGSPLSPTRAVVFLHGEYQDVMNRLHRRVRKPQGVEQWVNVWAKGDPFSGPIAAADHNVQADAAVPAEAARLMAALDAGAPRRLVARDLAALTDGIRWHLSYLHGFKARLETLGTAVDWPVPAAVVQSVAH